MTDLARRILNQTDPPQPTADAIVATHGLTGTQLMGLVRAAITAELGKRSIYLPPTDFEDLHSRIVEIAIGLAYDHDPRLGSLSYPTRVFRTARWRTLDYIRRERIPATLRTTEEALDDLNNREHVDHALVDALDIGELIVTRHQRQAWAAAASRAGLTLTAWLITSLDHAAATAQEAA